MTRAQLLALPQHLARPTDPQLAHRLILLPHKQDTVVIGFRTDTLLHTIVAYAQQISFHLDAPNTLITRPYVLNRHTSVMELRLEQGYFLVPDSKSHLVILGVPVPPS